MTWMRRLVAGLGLIAATAFTGEAAAAKYRVVEAINSSRVILAGEFNKTSGAFAGSKNFLIMGQGGERPAGVQIVNVNGPVHGARVHNGAVFIWGGFSQVNGQSRNKIAKLSMTGALLPWTAGVPVQKLNDIVPHGSNLFLVGDFGNKPVRKISATTGAAVAGFTLYGVRNNSRASAAAVLGNSFYVSIGRGLVTRHDVNTGSKTASFQHPLFPVLEFLPSGNSLYMAGLGARDGKQVGIVSMYPAAGGNRQWERTLEGIKPTGMHVVSSKLWVWGEALANSTHSLIALNKTLGYPSGGWVSGDGKCAPRRIYWVDFRGSKRLMGSDRALRCDSGWNKAPRFLGSPF